MFKSITKNNIANSPNSSHEITRTHSSLIAAGTTIEGKFKSSDDVRVEGTIRGEFYCEKQLIVGDTGWIEGTIKVTDATIRGHIKGNLHVKGTLRLESTAKIDGIIIAKTMEVEEGAQYEGECKIGTGSAQKMSKVA